MFLTDSTARLVFLRDPVSKLSTFFTAEFTQELKNIMNCQHLTNPDKSDRTNERTSQLKPISGNAAASGNGRKTQEILEIVSTQGRNVTL